MIIHVYPLEKRVVVSSYRKDSLAENLFDIDHWRGGPIYLPRDERNANMHRARMYEGRRHVLRLWLDPSPDGLRSPKPA